MGDAMTHIARDQRRGELYGEYLEALIWHLEVPNEENKKRALERAGQTDSVGSGYFGSQTDISRELEGELQKLVDNDKQAWAKLLARLARFDFGSEFKRLKSLSPFADQIFILVDYGSGFVSFYGEHRSMMDSFVREKGWKVGDCDDYVVILPEAPRPSDVIWVGCGIGGVHGPRPHGSR